MSGTKYLHPFPDISLITIDGDARCLAEFVGRATLIVNVASQCGFTPQYAGLASLHADFRVHGLAVLGFPCDQFGHQEPGDEKAIKEFCAVNYRVDFPLFAKIDVNGPRTHPLYRFLKSAAPGLLGLQRIHWNFTKFLVGSGGADIRRYAPTTKPAALRREIARLLGR